MILLLLTASCLLNVWFSVPIVFNTLVNILAFIIDVFADGIIEFYPIDV